MDYYQGVVTEYLRSDRSTFVNTECLIQLDAAKIPDKGAHWYCDAVVANLRETRIYLCEVTYSKTLQALFTRLRAWSTHWPALCSALRRDCSAPPNWEIQPWLFMPKDRYTLYQKKVAQLTFSGTDGNMPRPKVTFLECVAPWQYEWDRKKANFAE
jgi:hypothetical protein